MNNCVLWKPVIGYEGLYEVSNSGEIKSIFYGKNPKILKKSKTTTGYYKIELSKNKKRKSFKVHRLVAIAFIPNIENKPNINHIDGNPLNNNIDNLEWCTQKENVIHAVEIGLKSKTYISKNELRRLYLVEKKPVRKLEEIYSVSNTVICDRLKEYGIETRSISQSKN